MRVLVTGASGFIGGHLAKHLLRSGEDVAVVLRQHSQMERLDAPQEERLVKLIYDGSTDSLISSFKDFKPEVVVHAASFFVAEHRSDQIIDLISSNVLFGTQILEAMILSDCFKLVNIGTSWQHFLQEEYNPVCLYAATKQAFETISRFYVEAKKLSITTLKLFDTFGPNDKRPKILPYLLDPKNSNKPKVDMSPGDQLIDLVYIDDVLAAILSAIERLMDTRDQGATEYAVSSGHPIKLRDLVAVITRITGNKSEFNWGGRSYREREVMIPWNTGKPLPGWKAQVTIEEGLKRILGDHVCH